MEHNYENKESKKDIKMFREKHDCKHCFLFEKPRRCLAMNTCLLDELYKHKTVRIKEMKTCPKDEGKNCPYGNEAGTCFGYCWKEILRDFYKAKESKEE